MTGPLPGHLVNRIFAERCPFGDDWPEAAAAWARWREAQDDARNLDGEAGHMRTAILRAPAGPAGDAQVAELVASLEALAPRQREASARAVATRAALLKLVFQ